MVPLASIADLATTATWDTPLGIAMILLGASILCAGLGVLLWGISRFGRRQP